MKGVRRRAEERVAAQVHVNENDPSWIPGEADPPILGCSSERGDLERGGTQAP